LRAQCPIQLLIIDTAYIGMHTQLTVSLENKWSK